MSIPEHSFFWLVGILEGEGSFTKGPPSRPNKPAVSMCSTDYDVAERVQHLMGGALMRRNRTPSGSVSPVNGRRYKDIYDVRLSGRPALKLMRELQPHMSRRRQQRIAAVLATAPAIGTSPSAPGKLTPRDKLEIRRQYATGDYTQAALGAIYGVSQSRISGVLRFS
jgi:hypothetical protein